MMFKFETIIGLLILMISSNRAAPTETSIPDLHSYLTNFGYLQKTNPQTSALISEDAFTDAIKLFQRFAWLNVTGIVDNKTIEMMNMPRCGVPDIIGRGIMMRKKRYALQGSRWRNKDLTYKISRYTKDLTNQVADEEFKKAFEVWSDVSGLTFTERKTGSTNIEILFAKLEHGDGEPFDGPGKTLAHAYFPQFGGDAHFDDDEFWTTKSRIGSNLFQVAAHELGHSLGLSHSDGRGALMAPFYRGYDSDFRLSEDDITAIQSLYGSNKKRLVTAAPKLKTTSAPRPNKKPELDICKTGTFDAITRTDDGNTYTFKGDYYWLMDDESFASGYPRKISEDWSGLPGNLDAALTWADGKTFFFKEDKYWRFQNQNASPKYPKLISNGFAGIPDNIDAAFVWGGNGKTYFIKDNKYWKFDSKKNPPVDYDYPKELKLWEGLPNKIDAAFQWKNGRTYFFSGPNYYRFNDKLFSVDPDFPRLSAIWWFGCTDPDQTGLKNLLKSKSSDYENEEYDSDGYNFFQTNSNLLTEQNAGNQVIPCLVLTLTIFLTHLIFL